MYKRFRKKKIILPLLVFFIRYEHSWFDNLSHDKRTAKT